MISEREELTLKNSATIVLSRGEDGYTVNITGFDKPMIGTFTDIQELAKQVGQKVYLVHRLDKDTSGLMIVAKTPAAAT